MWLALHYPRTLAELFWNTLRSHPLQVMGIAFAVTMSTRLIQLVFYIFTDFSMPINGFMYPRYMGDNVLVTFAALKLYEACGLFLAGMLLNKLSRHSVAGIFFHFLTAGSFWLVIFTRDWLDATLADEMYALLMSQFAIWYGAMLAGSRLMHRIGTGPSPPPGLAG
jgi:hypothetical protein